MAFHSAGEGNQEENGRQNGNHEDVTVVMVPLPAQGHLNLFLHLARYVSSYNVPVHYVCSPAHSRQVQSRIHGWDHKDDDDDLHGCSRNRITFHEFGVPSYETPPPNPNNRTKYPVQLLPAFYASLHLREPISQLLQKLSNKTRRLVVIHDALIPYVVQDICSIPNGESYSFLSTSAFYTYSVYWELEGKPESLPESQLLQLLPKDTYPPEAIAYMLSQLEVKINSSGTLFHSCRAIDGPYLDHLTKLNTFTKKYWAVGPLNPITGGLRKYEEEQKPRHHCLEWLDKQAPNSVVFVSFGTTTSLSDQEIKVIAVGLEESNQKFLWVLRDADTGHLFNQKDRSLEDKLPQGFETRMNRRGIIVRDWAPQSDILAHSSTGGFLSHCGWGSCMESISRGVPMALWPMHSDHPTNSVLMTQVLKVGLLVVDWSPAHGNVTPKAIQNAVRRLMDSSEGDAMRQRAQEVSKTVKESIAAGGGRPLEMDSFVAHIRR
ncbi:OLC1v1036734C1 [Oldenlandia corymbosa var. corymbosa]|uniref:Glycosyltransferase n=1 Tax=Oldenlandia corymbosa var. corymbosa TaxID=529605 RepID=A0AAV1CZN1_OLDCO|nr:OLC1v1036734C1 [Oldenlandia corymbosa var. corymbosa]